MIKCFSYGKCLTTYIICGRVNKFQQSYVLFYTNLIFIQRIPSELIKVQCLIELKSKLY